MKRRSFLVGAGVAAAAGAGVHWLARSRDYDAAATTLWSHRSSASGVEFADLVHYATLAANSHNAQPWHFRLTPGGVAISPDFGRSLPVADADHHHLYASLGCAAENLMLAVRAAGRASELAFDPAFVAELCSWLRFNAAAAVASGDGLHVACSGNPTLPIWLGSMLFAAFFKPAAESARHARQVRSSSGLAVFVAARDDREHWVQAGRSYQRFALQATALGIRHAHLNQPLEVAPLRRQLGALLGVGDRRVDLLVRYGHAAPMPRSLRRPPRDVIIAA